MVKMEKTEEGIVKLNLEQMNKFITNWDKEGRTKGLLIMGPPGHGKTHLMKSLDWIQTFKDGSQANGSTTMHRVVELYEKNGSIDFLSSSLLAGLSNTQRYFDDLGSERDAFHYGSVTNVMELLVDKFKGASYTTNLNLEELTSKYGPRVISRLKEYCYIIALVDQDFRLLNNEIEIETILNK
jgi:Cdc6-like AAA superfamily ATPase